ncbi:unnamed protein product [Rhizophagus irregularis]|nr:unnamed protein product [Rhizophagus irregularis]
MPPLPSLLNQYIVRTDIKVNKSNLKTFCKPCIEVLGEEEGQKISFPNKKDRIIQHFKKCDNFFAKTNEEEREKIFAILQPNNNDVPSIIPQKRSYSISSQTSQVSLASSSSHKVINRSSYYGPMDNYIVRSLSKEDLQKFHMLLLRLTVSCGWALSWVNKPEAKELFDFLNPFLKLPDRRVLGGDILKQVVADSDKAMETAIKEDPVAYVWKAVDISSERENYTAVIEKTEAMLTELRNKEITVCAIVTDSASAYVAARRRMRISNRSIIFLPCFAHQINLCVGEIFKESTEFKTTIDRAIKLATYFNNSNHKYFIACLRDQQYKTYKKCIAISVPGETRWNSLYNMCISLLKTQQALQILAINFKPPIVETRRRQGEALTLPREIFEIIDSSIFWDHITLINNILEPYCKLLNVLQCDKARLFQVVHSMNYLVRFWLNYSDDTLATRIISRLEKRWKDWEQPLLLLSYLLHPEYRMNQFNNATSINYSEFGKWLMYYYRVWSGKEPKCILREFDDFWLAKYPFDLESYRQFNDDIWRYWCYVSVSTNELGLVACRIFGICSSKALQMSKLRADITYGHRLHNNPILIEPTLDIDDANETDTNQNPGNLNGLENNRGNDPAVNLETNPKPIEVDYDSDDKAFEPQLENDFGDYLQGWTEMLKEEENAEIDEVDEESNTSLDDITHPANDTSAKWELITLFNNNIDVSLPF